MLHGLSGLPQAISLDTNAGNEPVRGKTMKQLFGKSCVYGELTVSSGWMQKLLWHAPV